MSLEIIITDNMIKISADWFWYALIILWIAASCWKTILKIQEILLIRKIKKFNHVIKQHNEVKE